MDAESWSVGESDAVAVVKAVSQVGVAVRDRLAEEVGLDDQRRESRKLTIRTRLADSLCRSRTTARRSLHAGASF